MPSTLIVRKEIEHFIVYERRPRPLGMTKYVVANAPIGKGETEMKDFGRFSAAVRWAKSQLPKPVPHLVLDLDDPSAGVSTMPVTYTILDEQHSHTHHATVDPAKVEGILGVIPTQ